MSLYAELMSSHNGDNDPQLAPRWPVLNFGITS
jgi:hypothetical protein